MPPKNADVLATLAVTAQPILWVSQVNAYMQLIGTAIGIIAGVYAIIWYRVKIKREEV